MFVTNSLSGGGAERATNILVNALTDSDQKVSLVAINDSPQDLIKPKCQIFELKRKWQDGLFSVFKAYFQLQLVIWKWKPEYLVLNCDIPEFLGSLTIGRHKLVVVEHATYPWINRIHLGKMTRRILNARNSKWVTVSDHLNIWGTQSLPDVSISNAISTTNLDRILPAGPIKRLNFVGRLSQEKQPLWALEVAKETKLPIRIFGVGLLMNELKEYAIEQRIEVEFRGFVMNPWEFFDAGDLLLVPSIFEGDGLVVVEAIANRIPLIVNDIPDLRRFKLRDENYASNENEFSNVVSRNKNEIEIFIPEESVRHETLKNREPVAIAQRWVSFLNS